MFGGKVFHKVGYGVCLCLHIRGGKRHTCGICGIYAVGMVYIIIALAVAVEAFRTLAVSQLTDNAADYLKMGEFFSTTKISVIFLLLLTFSPLCGNINQASAMLGCVPAAKSTLDRRWLVVYSSFCFDRRGAVFLLLCSRHKCRWLLTRTREI